MKRAVLMWGGATLLLGLTVVGALVEWAPEAVAPAVEAAAFPPEAEMAPESRRSPVFPVVDDAHIAFEDFPFAGVDERSSYRQFTIPLSAGKRQFLAATYLDEPDWISDRNDDAALIFRLADLNAGFSEHVVVDLPPRGDWSRIRLHIGDFAQDYCGEMAMVVSFRNARIFATTDLPSAELDFAASQCPLRPEAFLADKARYGKRDEPDDFSAFCAVRRECLQAHYAKPENQAALVPGWLPEVAGIVLR